MIQKGSVAKHPRALQKAALSYLHAGDNRINSAQLFRMKYSIKHIAFAEPLFSRPNTKGVASGVNEKSIAFLLRGTGVARYLFAAAPKVEDDARAKLSTNRLLRGRKIYING